MQHHSIVGIVTTSRLGRFRVRNSARTRAFSLLINVQLSRRLVGFCSLSTGLLRGAKAVEA